MGRKVYLLGGEGNATAALVAGTVSNVAVVTLPADVGYEYDVSISVVLKLAASACTATAQIGGNSFLLEVASATIGEIFPIPYISLAGTNSSTESMSVNTVSSGPTTALPVTAPTHTVKAAPGQAITCPIISNVADTYYLHYSYIGRKVVESSNGGF